MTTSFCSLIGPDGADSFDMTDTGDAFVTMVNETSNLNLYEVMKGKRITHFIGDHAAGGTLVRVRNTITNKVKMLECLDVHGEAKVRPVEKPFTVDENDILEGFHVVVPT